MTWLLIGVVAFIVLLAPLRWVIHRSLAPARVIEARTPASVGLSHQDAFIPTENNKTLFGWFIPKNLPGRSPAVVLLEFTEKKLHCRHLIRSLIRLMCRVDLDVQQIHTKSACWTKSEY